MGLAQDMAGAGMNNLGARLLMSSSRQALADRAGNSTTAVPRAVVSPSWLSTCSSRSTTCTPSSTRLSAMRARHQETSPKMLGRRTVAESLRRKPASPIQFVISCPIQEMRCGPTS